MTLNDSSYQREVNKQIIIKKKQKTMRTISAQL